MSASAAAIMRASADLGVTYACAITVLCGPDAPDRAFAAAVAAEHGLALTTDDPVHEICQLATDEVDKASAILDEASVPVGRMVAALRRVLGLEMMDQFFILYADSHRQTTAFMLPIATAAKVYLSQRSGHFEERACVVGAAYLHD